LAASLGGHSGGVRVEWILRQQAGVISRSQATDAGMTARQIHRLLAARRWVPVHPAVFLASDRELTDEGRVRAAALWAGEPVTLSGIVAAWWHGLWPDPPSTVELTVPVRRCLRARTGTRVRRRDLCDVDRVGLRGLWVTGVPLTVLEAAVALGERGSEMLDRSLQSRVRFATLHRAQCRNVGRRGALAAGRLLAATADRAASAAERKLIALLRGAGIGGWELHHRVGGYELDLAFADHWLAVEVDGWAWHSDVGAFRNDRQRQNSLVLAGWTILRFTWHDLTQRPGEVVAEIRVMIASSEA
jgi:very-short-patch-repair endonuclease